MAGRGGGAASLYASSRSSLLATPQVLVCFTITQHVCSLATNGEKSCGLVQACMQVGCAAHFQNGFRPMTGNACRKRLRGAWGSEPLVVHGSPTVKRPCTVLLAPERPPRATTHMNMHSKTLTLSHSGSCMLRPHPGSQHVCLLPPPPL